MFPDRVSAALDRRLDPPDDTLECPHCEARLTAVLFTEAVRDAVEQAVGPVEARDFFSSSRQYADDIRAMADWIEDTVRERVEHEGGRACFQCAAPDEDDT